MPAVTDWTALVRAAEAMALDCGKTLLVLDPSPAASPPDVPAPRLVGSAMCGTFADATGEPGSTTISTASAPDKDTDNKLNSDQRHGDHEHIPEIVLATAACTPLLAHAMRGAAVAGQGASGERLLYVGTYTNNKAGSKGIYAWRSTRPPAR